MRLRQLLWGFVLVLALSAGFVVQTALVSRLPAALAASVAVVPAALALMLVSSRLPKTPALDRRDTLIAAGIGLAVWLVPFLVAAGRKSDTPPGSEVLFLTTAVWGLLLVLGGLASARPSPSAARVAGALLGVTGAVGILANWERPSSFSPFVRYQTEELVMLLAGAVWVAAVTALAGLVRRHGPIASLRAVALPAGAAGVIGALLLAPSRLALLAPSRLALLATPGVGLFALLAAMAAFASLLAWARLLKDVPTYRIAAAYFLPPVVLTAFSAVERATVAYGPNPVVWPPALAGMAVVAAAAVVTALPDETGVRTPAPDRTTLVARGLAILALGLAAAGLASTDLVVSVKGSLTSGAAFSATFGMSGFETAGGWLAACCSLFVASWAWGRRPSRRIAITWLAALAVAAAAWIPVHTTVTHAWTAWIPAEVQQDFGTEYAQRTVRTVSGPWEPAALLVALAAGSLSSIERRASAESAHRDREVSSG
ncbi:MAG TPA: hypothetical protein VGK50_00215 [Coriobacteriia bacterium]|jgi:hypothetical protein